VAKCAETLVQRQVQCNGIDICWRLLKES